MILDVLYTTLPITLGGIFHMFAIRAGWWRRFARPLDGGVSWRGRRIFGDHKTWRGLVLIVASTMLLTGVQYAAERASPAMAGRNLVDLATLGWWQAGMAWGFGYALAELPNSFMKRRLGVAPGAGAGGISGVLLAFLDQADSALGVGCAGWLLLGASAGEALWIAGVCTALHLTSNAALGLARIRARPL